MKNLKNLFFGLLVIGLLYRLLFGSLRMFEQLNLMVLQNFSFVFISLVIFSFFAKREMRWAKSKFMSLTNPWKIRN